MFDRGYVATMAERLPSNAEGGCFFRQEEDFDPNLVEYLPGVTTHLDENGVIDTATDVSIEEGRGIAFDFRGSRPSR